MATLHIRNRLLVFGALAVVAVAAPASAADRFDDVTANSVHAGPIGEVADAGITAGCAIGRFCPRDEVTREQMASFLARSGTRSTFGTDITELTASNGFDGVAASVTARSAAATGGTSTVTLHGSVTVYADSSDGGNVTACPCEVEAFIYRDSDEAQGPSGWTQLPGTFASSGRSSTSVPVTWMTTIPSGTSESFRIAVFLNDASPSGVRAEGALTAIVGPFS
jgi:hypothetical protein